MAALPPLLPSSGLPANMTGGDCKNVHSLNHSLQCSFVEQNDDCQDCGGHINYVELYFCQLAPLAPYILAVLAAWLGMLFIALGTAADDFFCPNLAIISKTLRLSQNIAGVTILAFGNGAPDIFSSLAGVSQSRPELVLGELFGAGVFVTTVVAGSVCITRPFKLMERPFLRDVVFYLFAAYWAFVIFYRQTIHPYDAIGFLVLYLVYISVVLIGRYVNQRSRRNRALLGHDVTTSDDGRDISDAAAHDDADLNIFIPHFTPHNRPPVVVDDDDVSGNGVGSGGEDTSSEEEVEDDTTLATVDVVNTRSAHAQAWLAFGRRLSPIDVAEFKTKSWRGKLWDVISAPVVFLLTVAVPVVDEDQPLDGWCQQMHVIHCYVTPQLVVFALDLAFIEVPGLNLELWYLTLLLSQALAVVLLCTSTPTQAPAYQPLLSYLGFGGAVVLIYVIANEIVSLLKFVGIIFGLSDAILGLTVLAWGNSIGDLISDIAIAKQGYPRMGYSACFGGPLFNLLMGFGIPFTLEFMKNGFQPIALGYDVMVIVLSASLAVSLITSFLMMPLTGFKGTKAHGVVLVVLYVVLLAAAITVEFVVVKK